MKTPQAIHCNTCRATTVARQGVPAHVCNYGCDCYLRSWRRHRCGEMKQPTLTPTSTEKCATGVSGLKLEEPWSSLGTSLFFQLLGSFPGIWVVRREEESLLFWCFFDFKEKGKKDQRGERPSPPQRPSSWKKAQTDERAAMVDVVLVVFFSRSACLPYGWMGLKFLAEDLRFFVLWAVVVDGSQFPAWWATLVIAKDRSWGITRCNKIVTLDGRSRARVIAESLARLIAAISNH